MSELDHVEEPKSVWMTQLIMVEDVGTPLLGTLCNCSYHLLIKMLTLQDQ
jgi:hypothetical protein